MSKPKLHNIYLVDKRKCTQHMRKKTSETKDIVQYLQRHFEGKRTPDGATEQPRYKAQKLLKREKGAFDILILYKRESPQNIIGEFFEDIVDPNSDICKEQHSSASSLLILWDDSNIFLIPTGQAHHHINRFIVPDFGFRIASIFKDNIHVGVISQNALTGNIHSHSDLFKSEIPLDGLQTPNSITKHILGHLTNNAHADLLLPVPSGRANAHPRLTIKSYIQFGRPMDFEQLMSHLHALVQKALPDKTTSDLNTLDDQINLIKTLNHKSEKFRNCLSRLAEEFLQESDRFFIMAEDAIPYLSAERYDILSGSSKKTNLKDQSSTIDAAFIIRKFRAYTERRKNTSNASEIETFENFIQGYNICSGDEETLYTKGSILSHLSGDITMGGSGYFVLNGEFYELNEDLHRQLKVTTDDILTKSLDCERFFGFDWKKLAKKTYKTQNPTFDENRFNDLVCTHSKQKKNPFYFFHTNSPRHIEFADMLQFTEDEAYIIHVKDGFDHSMRVLCRQVDISLQQYALFTSRRGSDYIHKLYDNATKEKQDNPFLSQFPEYETFRDRLLKSDITYVLAVHTNGTALNDTRSTSALFCLEQTRQLCLRHGVKIKIVTI